jgi:hypothetical protein
MERLHRVSSRFDFIAQAEHEVNQVLHLFLVRVVQV